MVHATTLCTWKGHAIKCLPGRRYALQESCHFIVRERGDLNPWYNPFNI
jgi:hypothetical protein